MRALRVYLYVCKINIYTTKGCVTSKTSENLWESWIKVKHPNNTKNMPKVPNYMNELKDTSYKKLLQIYDFFYLSSPKNGTKKINGTILTRIINCIWHGIFFSLPLCEQLVQQKGGKRHWGGSRKRLQTRTYKKIVCGTCVDEICGWRDLMCRFGGLETICMS